MFKSVEGVFRDGKVELLEPAPQEADSRVVITFLPSPGPIDLASRGIDPEQAARLRRQFASIAEDWDDPAMDVYNEM